MTAPVKIQLIYAPDDYVRALKFIQGRTFIMRHALEFAVISFACAGVAYVLTAFLNESVNDVVEMLLVFAIAPFFIVGLGLSIIRFLPTPILKWQISRQIASSPAMQAEQDLEINSTGLCGRTALGSGETKWSAFIEVVESDSDFLFFTARKFALFVPKAAVSPAELSPIRAFILANVDHEKVSLQSH